MGFYFGQQGPVVLLWELEHFLKMDHLGLVERYWSEMNTVGIEVYSIPTTKTMLFCFFLNSFLGIGYLTFSLI